VNLTNVKFDTAAQNRRIGELLDKLQSETLIPRPEFQRRLVWNNKDKNEFLRTVLKGYPFPEIYIAVHDADVDTAKLTEALVDGQQRVTTLFQYFKGSEALRLEKDITPFANLSKDQKVEYLNYQVAVRHLGIVGMEVIKEVFKRINRTAYSLRAIEQHNAEYQGPLKKLAERFATSRFFSSNRVFSDREIRRMGDVVFALSLVITMMGTYFHRESEIEKYLETYNDELPQEDELVSRFARVVSVIYACRLPSDCRVWKKADLFVLIVELDRLLFIDRSTLDLQKLKSVLIQFYRDVDSEMRTSSGNDNLQRYFKSTLQATADRASRLARAEVLRAVMLTCVK
jgi:hypothetical protein